SMGAERDGPVPSAAARAATDGGSGDGEGRDRQLRIGQTAIPGKRRLRADQDAVDTPLWRRANAEIGLGRGLTADQIAGQTAAALPRGRVANECEIANVVVF